MRERDIIATMLAQSRYDAGLTQDEMAHKIGCALSTLKTWENGTSSIKSDIILKWFALLKVSPIKYYFDVINQSKKGLDAEEMIKHLPQKHKDILNEIIMSDSTEAFDILEAYLDCPQEVKEWLYKAIVGKKVIK